MRIGIITHYYKSKNYGGNLQAWALCRVIHALGHEVEQISLKRSEKRNLKIFIAKILIGVRDNCNLKNFWGQRKRRKAFAAFNECAIPHSIVYTEKSISKCSNDYDVFITGSDQVWHPQACCDAYLLKFVSPVKTKMSYAASIAHHELTETQKNKYKNAFRDFKAISVREKEAVELLADISPVEVEWTLDPTLLLTREEWDELYVKPRIEEDYLFCYFLGDDVKERELATEFAKEKNLKIVTLPDMLGRYRKCDKGFGDYKLYDVTPQEFVSFIKDAKYVFTDSFHGTILSWIFEKEHFVFHRSEYKSMATRINGLVSLFGTEDHFCDTEDKVRISYIEGVTPIDYTKDFDEYYRMKEKSIAYLKRSIG